LISDIEVAQTVWGLQNWYGKVVVAIILGHYVVRATVVTFHVSRYMGDGRLHSPAADWRDVVLYPSCCYYAACARRTVFP